jgi:integrase
VVALFNHAEAHGFIQYNPAARLKMARKTKKEKDYRAPFDQEDLKRLFPSEDYHSDAFKHSYMFWMPVLALFTGARLNELAQLHLDDIKPSQGARVGDVGGAGVWYLDINDDGPTKKLKNLASRRKVPLHPFIVKELNLPGRVEELRSKGQERLFPELRHGVHGFGKNVSRWFNQIYRAKVGISEDDHGRPKHFHSFRATFSTHLGQKRGIVDDKLLKQVLGHADDGSTTFNTYVDDFTPEQLLEGVILHIDYGIDLSHLKASKWVPNG